MSAGDLYFVDTNVLLYAADGRDRRKQRTAQQWLDKLWQDGNGRISWQVLHEYYINAVRKIAVPEPTARDTVEALIAWRPVYSSRGLVQAAWHCMDDAHVSYWDALVIAAAQRAGCQWLLSEDLQSGQSISGLTVLNPFLIKQ